MKKILVLSIVAIVSLVGLYAFTNNAEGAYYTRDGLKKLNTRNFMDAGSRIELDIKSTFSISLIHGCKGSTGNAFIGIIYPEIKGERLACSMPIL